MPIVYANLEKFLSCTVSSSRMWGNEEPEKSSTIRYTEFEKRIIRRSSNLYKGYWFPYGGYMLSSCYVGVSIVFPLVSLGLCLGRPTLSSILLLSARAIFLIRVFKRWASSGHCYPSDSHSAFHGLANTLDSAIDLFSRSSIQGKV
jgi:hypothetical protein